MNKIIFYFALLLLSALLINSAFLLDSDKAIQSFLRISDSSKIVSPDIHPEYYYGKSNFNIVLPFVTSYSFTNSVFPNINISRDSFPQNEPSVKISRKNPNIVLAAWRDFRTGVSPPLRRIGYSRSTDGGTTWDNSRLLPPYNSFYQLASDRAVCVDTSGNFYVSTISLNIARTNLTVIVYKSTNQGLTFDNAFSVSPHTDSGYFYDDKDYIACDLVPGSPYRNNLYVAWASGDSGHVISRSTNGGINWSNRVILPWGGIGILPIVGAEGEVYVTWIGFGSGAIGIYVTKSTNGGLNFSSPVLIDTVQFGSYLARLPSMAADISDGPRNGYVYAVWSNRALTEQDEDIFFSASSDRGINWSPRKRVNNDSLYNGKKQYWPWISVNELGNIFIIFYDTRNTPSLQIIEAYLAYSTNGGQTFINEVISTQQSPTNFPNSEIRFGDYIGIDVWGGRIVPVWTDERAGGFNQEIYTALIVDTLIGIKPIAGEIPAEFRLYQNYPNPFNPGTKIKFEIPERCAVNLKIYDVLGREVETLVSESLKPGTYEIKWNGSRYSSGIYFYSLKTEVFAETKKMILVK
jgi:Secretion system C-terminal sorting domain